MRKFLIPFALFLAIVATQVNAQPLPSDSSDIVWQKNTEQIIGLCISPDSKYVVTDCLGDNFHGDYDSLKVRIWDIKDGTLLKEFSGETSSCFSKDGTILVTKLKDTIFIRQSSSWLIIKKIETDGLGQPYGYGFDISPDNKYIVSSAGFLGLKIFEIESGILKKKFIDFPYMTDQSGHGQRFVSKARYSTDGTQIYFSGDWTFVYDINNNIIIDKYEGYDPLLSPDNTHFGNTGIDKSVNPIQHWITIYNRNTKTRVNNIQFGSDRFNFSFSIDGKNIISTNKESKGTVDIWDTFTGLKKYTYSLPLIPYWQVACTNDGTSVVACSAYNIYLLKQKFTSVQENGNSTYTILSPNPTSGIVKIDFILHRSEIVTLKISNNTGNTIDTLNLGLREIGNNSFSYNASDLPSGIYYFTLQTLTFSQTYKLVKE